MPVSFSSSPAGQLARSALRQRRCWLVTGVAGFIGSHLLDALLRHGQQVVGLDNLMTGHRHNLEQVRQGLPEEAWASFRFIEGDIRSPDTCAEACRGVELVLHQAALGSVPRSLEHPVLTSDINMLGFVNVLVAARDAGVRRVVYASSSAVYGDDAGLPKVEAHTGRPLSPYAVTKVANELHADVFARSYGTASIGLRYFNVFGPRQDPNGPYAAVIPQWFAALMRQAPLAIHGDGDNSRDFCYVDNAVQANLLAALATSDQALNRVYNVACGERTSLNALYQAMRELMLPQLPALARHRPDHTPPRAGDVRHSLADIALAQRLLGYAPTHSLRDGLRETLAWTMRQFGPPP
jgi:UDP-N-acetylglucosamine/UDP-N-acetylgalactosamine 4-epimerase